MNMGYILKGWKWSNKKKSKKKKDPSGIKAFDFIQENKRGYLN